MADSPKRGIWRRHVWLWGPVILCMGAIFYLSSQPKPPEVSWLRIFVFDGEDYGDKIKHLIAYLVLGALIWRALSRNAPRWWQIGAAVALATAYGLTDESHQIFVPGRSFDPLDLGADALGAAIAAVALTLWKGGTPIGKKAQEG